MQYFLRLLHVCRMDVNPRCSVTTRKAEKRAKGDSALLQRVYTPGASCVGAKHRLSLHETLCRDVASNDIKLTRGKIPNRCRLLERDRNGTLLVLASSERWFFVCRGNTRLLLVGFWMFLSIREPFLHAPAPYRDENKIRCVHVFPIISFFNSHLPSLWPIRKLCVLILFFVFLRFFFSKGTQFFRKRDSTCFHLKAMPGRGEEEDDGDLSQNLFCHAFKAAGLSVSYGFSNNRMVCASYQPVITLRAIKRH